MLKHKTKEHKHKWAKNRAISRRNKFPKVLETTCQPSDSFVTSFCLFGRGEGLDCGALTTIISPQNGAMTRAFKKKGQQLEYGFCQSRDLSWPWWKSQSAEWGTSQNRKGGLQSLRSKLHIFRGYGRLQGEGIFSENCLLPCSATGIPLLDLLTEESLPFVGGEGWFHSTKWNMF